MRIFKIKQQTLKNHQAQGFTLIEVSLFIALTGLVLVGIISTFSSISHQRYDDSVQNFAEYVRNLYSRAANVQNTSCKSSSCSGSGNNACCGQSGTAIYGIVATFNGNNIKSYSIIGNAHISNDVANPQQALSANPVVNGVPKTGAAIRVLSGSGQDYTPLWQSTIQVKDGNKNNLSSSSVFIVRSPNSGVIHTYLLNSAVTDNADLSNVISSASVQPINFCVNSDDAGGKVRNIRIAADAHNASGVELIPIDSGDSACKS